MAKRCSECHTVTIDDRLGRCTACGARLSGEKFQRRWENRIVAYIAITVLTALAAAAVVFLLYARGG
jgi:hypothetical protein